MRHMKKFILEEIPNHANLSKNRVSIVLSLEMMKLEMNLENSSYIHHNKPTDTKIRQLKF